MIFMVNILTVIYLIIEILRKLHIGVLKWIVHKSASIATSVILTATAEFSIYSLRSRKAIPMISKQTYMTKKLYH